MAVAATRKDESGGPWPIVIVAVGLLVLAGIGASIYAKKHKKAGPAPRPSPTQTFVASTASPADAQPEPSPSESPLSDSDITPELKARIADVARRAPYRQLHELEKLLGGPELISPSARERLDRSLSDLRKSEDALEGPRAALKQAVLARDDQAVFQGMQSFAQTLRASSPPHLVPVYDQNCGILRELPACIEIVAGRHAASQGIQAKADYLAKRFTNEQALAVVAQVPEKDERLRLGAAVIAAAAGLPLPKALTPGDWAPVDAVLDELGLERPAAGP